MKLPIARVSFWLIAGGAALVLLLLAYMFNPFAAVSLLGAGAAAAATRHPSTRKRWLKLVKIEAETRRADAEAAEEQATLQAEQAEWMVERVNKQQEAEVHRANVKIAQERIDELTRELSRPLKNFAAALVFTACALSPASAAAEATCIGLSGPDECPWSLSVKGQPGCWIPTARWAKRTERANILMCQARASAKENAAEVKATLAAVATASIAFLRIGAYKQDTERLRGRRDDLFVQVATLLAQLDRAQEELRQCPSAWGQLLTHAAAGAVGAATGLLTCNCPDAIVIR